MERLRLDEVVMGNPDDGPGRRPAGSRRPRRRVGAVVGVLVVCAAGVGAGLELTDPPDPARYQLVAGPDDSPSPSATTTSDSSSSPSPASPLTNLYAAGRMLGITKDGRLELVQLDGSGGEPQQLDVHRLPGPGRPTAIATLPHLGWVVSYVPGPATDSVAAPTRLAEVEANGMVTPFGTAIASGQRVTSLAVTPDGSRVALATESDGAGAAAIEVRAIPGFAGPGVQRWTLDRAQVSEVISLSWSPDGRYLTYISGDNTGAGIGGDPSVLDTEATGDTAPTAAAWATGGKNCSWVAVAWIGAKDIQLAGECPSVQAMTLVEVDPTDGQPLSVPVHIGERGCLDTSLRPDPTRDRLLVLNCGEMSVEHHGQLDRLPVDFLSGSF